MADKPVTREEKYLAYLTGDYKGELPKPITRKEKYLYELCLKGIGGEISPEEIKAAVNEYLEKNPVKPGATTEQAQQIEQNKTDIGSLKTETGSLKEDLSDLSKSVNGIELSKNLLDNSSIIANKRPSNWAGQTINDSYKTDGYHTFKAIPVTQNNTYYFVENGDLVNFGQLATYDKDGKYVSLLSPSVFNVNGVKVGYIIPENIAYVRGESKTSDFSNVNFKLFNGRFEKKVFKI